MSTALSTQVDSLRSQLLEKKENIFAAAAEHIRPERFLELVARACIRNPDLLNCSRSSLFMAAAQAAQIGLDIDGVLGHAYLIPFKGQATLVPGYLGLKELAYRSGRIADISYGAVHPDDEFAFEYGTKPFLRHVPTDDATNGAVTHVYAVVHTTTGGVVFNVMSWVQVEAHRNKFAKGYTRADSAWKTNPVAMGQKTALRKALKLCPLSAELQQMLQAEEYAEQPLFPSGTEADTSDLDPDALDAADALLSPPDDVKEPWPDSPSSMTPEEQRDFAQSELHY